VPVRLLGLRSEAWACGCACSLVGTAGSNPAGGMDVCLLGVLCVVQVVVSTVGRSLVQRSPTEWCVCVCVSLSVLKGYNSLQCDGRGQEQEIKRKWGQPKRKLGSKL